VLQQRELCVAHVVFDALLSVIKKVGDDRSAVAQIREICTFFEFYEGGYA
jgi:hypothetical protein